MLFISNPFWILVCHSPGVPHRVMYNGAPLLKGKRVTGFTNEEEEEVHLTHVVPFLAALLRFSPHGWGSKIEWNTVMAMPVSCCFPMEHSMARGPSTYR